MPPKANPFMLFVDDQRRTNPDLKQGKNNMAKMVELCGPLWDRLPTDEKARYKARAKELKSSSGMPPTWTSYPEGALDARGRPLAETHRSEAEVRKQADDDLALVEEAVRSSGNLRTVKILVAEASLFYDDPSADVVLPAELAVAKFSVESGVLACFHKLVDPGPIPSTFSRAKIVQNAEKTHRLEVGAPFLDADYGSIVEGFREFVAGGSAEGGLFGPNVIFALPGRKKQLESSLRWLYRMAGEEYPGIRILNLSHLLHNLVQVLARKEADAMEICPSAGVALLYLEADLWSYVSGMTCDVHASIDVSNSGCSLARAKRLVYIICHHCCGILGVSLVRGRHFPRAVVSDDTVHGEWVDEDEVAPYEDEGEGDSKSVSGTADETFELNETVTTDG